MNERLRSSLPVVTLVLLIIGGVVGCSGPSNSKTPGSATTDSTPATSDPSTPSAKTPPISSTAASSTPFSGSWDGSACSVVAAADAQALLPGVGPGKSTAQPDIGATLCTFTSGDTYVVVQVVDASIEGLDGAARLDAVKTAQSNTGFESVIIAGNAGLYSEEKLASPDLTLYVNSSGGSRAQWLVTVTFSSPVANARRDDVLALNAVVLPRLP